MATYANLYPCFGVAGNQDIIECLLTRSLSPELGKYDDDLKKAIATGSIWSATIPGALQFQDLKDIYIDVKSKLLNGLNLTTTEINEIDNLLLIDLDKAYSKIKDAIVAAEAKISRATSSDAFDTAKLKELRKFLQNLSVIYKSTPGKFPADNKTGAINQPLDDHRKPYSQTSLLTFNRIPYTGTGSVRNAKTLASQVGLTLQTGGSRYHNADQLFDTMSITGTQIPFDKQILHGGSSELTTVIGELNSVLPQLDATKRTALQGSINKLVQLNESKLHNEKVLGKFIKYMNNAAQNPQQAAAISQLKGGYNNQAQLLQSINNQIGSIMTQASSILA